MISFMMFYDFFYDFIYEILSTPGEQNAAQLFCKGPNI